VAPHVAFIDENFSTKITSFFDSFPTVHNLGKGSTVRPLWHWR